MVLRHLCRPRDPCGAEIKAGAVSINDALALSIAELDSTQNERHEEDVHGHGQWDVIDQVAARDLHRSEYVVQVRSYHHQRSLKHAGPYCVED